MQPLFFLQYSHPVTSFFVYGFTMAIIIAIAFAVNDEIDWQVRFKPHRERIRIKMLSHFIIAFFVVSILYIILYYLFGFGSNLFPLCSYVENCKKLK